MSSKRICLVPLVSGVGGMVSFRAKIVQGLKVRGVEVCYDLTDQTIHTVLVIGGTRQITRLWRLKSRGVRIVQRLDGMNWLHRRVRTGTRHYLRAEFGNLLLSIIRRQVADVVVYQSRFAKEWWERRQGTISKANSVIYNGVDLEVFSPRGNIQPSDRLQLLVVEGSLMGGYELGLENALRWALGVADVYSNAHSHYSTIVELSIIGKVPESVMQKWNLWLSEYGRNPALKVNWAGLIPHERIPEIDRSAHVLFSTDVNAACPNSVIEALACGTPVVAYDTGALPELVDEHSGKIVPYGGDPWKLDPPDIQGLVMATGHVLNDLARFRQGARSRAEDLFGVDTMIDAYLQALLD